MAFRNKKKLIVGIDYGTTYSGEFVSKEKKLRLDRRLKLKLKDSVLPYLMHLISMISSLGQSILVPHLIMLRWP